MVNPGKLRTGLAFPRKGIWLCVLAAATALAEENATISVSALITDPMGGNPATAAPGDIISYSVSVANNSSAGEFLHGIDLVNNLPTGTGSFAAGTATGGRVVRVFRDNITNGNGFVADAGTAGNDGNTNFNAKWQETAGALATGENNGVSGAGNGDDVTMLADGGRYVLRIRDDDNEGDAANDRGEGAFRIANLNSCTAAVLTFEISGLGLDGGGGETGNDGIYLDQSTNGTTWTQLVRFDPDGTTDGTLTDANRDIVNNTYQSHAVSLTAFNATTYIRFITDRDVANAEGAHIDNVQITALCEAASPAVAAPPNLLTSTVYAGTNLGLNAGSLVTTYSVTVNEGQTANIDNSALVRYTDLVGNTTTIAGTEQTLTNTSATNTVTVALRDDFGDAPESEGYTTLLANNGPRHRVVAGLHLGTVAPDLDSGGFADGSEATGDATEDDAGGDEGIAQLLSGAPSEFPFLAAQDTSYSISVNATNSGGSPATLYGWIDFDQDGEFDQDERASALVAAGAGATTATLTWTGLGTSTNVIAGDTFARFRVTTTNIDLVANGSNEDDASLGFAADGEVEDYAFTVQNGRICYAAFSDASITNSVRNLSGLTPVATGLQSSWDVVTNNNDANNDNYGMVFTARLIVPSSDTYQFRMDSDDGSHLYINNVLVIDHDALQAMGNPETGSIYLTAGVHDLQLFYFENGGQQNLTLEWDVSGSFAPLTNEHLDTPPSCPANPQLPLDYGDALDNAAGTGSDDYRTRLANNGPRHAYSTGLFLGSAAPDYETDALHSANADGDDNDNLADEGAAQLLSSLSAFPLSVFGEALYSIDIDLTNTVGTARLYAWIDWDRNGSFDEDELLDGGVQTLSNGATSATLNFVPNGDAVLGTTRMRVRITTDNLSASGGGEDERSYGIATNGEVEDHLITVTEVDFGDAPIAYGAASHAIPPVVNLYLGPIAPDGEASTRLGLDAGASATGDNQDGTDDETSLGAIPPISTADLGQPFILDVAVVNSANDAEATLFGWIDFDRNGTFDSDEGVSIDTPSTGTYQLQWTVPGDVDAGISYIRLRLTTDASVTSATPSSSALDGEVEDYALAIAEPVDFGDAPDTGAGTGLNNYRTLLSNDGPRHAMGANIYLGDTAPDAELDANANGTATGDDAAGNSDEGVEQLLAAAYGAAFPDIAISDTSFSFDLDLTNSVGPAYLYAWVDWDQSGTFDEDEIATGTPISVANAATGASVTFVVPDDAVVGNLFMRLRITSDLLTANGSGEDERSYGAASDGEVEDYRLVVQGLDFGDAPASYGTLLIDNGPSHVPLGTLYIGGAQPDREPDGNPSAQATGDDTTGIDDEGGFFIPPLTSISTNYSIEVPVFNQTGETATLFGWLDFEVDGDFSAAGEGVSVAVPDGATSVTLNWPSFSLGAGPQTFLRLRLTRDPAITSTTPGGPAADGEVEDHIVAIGQFDWGDAPASYGTDSTPCNCVDELNEVGPHHLIVAGLQIGDAPTPTADGEPSALAQGSGSDEDNSFPGPLPVLSDVATEYSISLLVTNTTGSDAELVGWIDFDGNGFFDNDEGATVTVPNGATSATLTWSSIPGDITDGVSYLRLRITSDSSVATGNAATSLPFGFAFNGEIEDHLLEIVVGYDYGDAPNSYGTLAASGGPRHRINPDLFIGAIAPDAESNGQPSADATGDDAVDANDEGGLFLTTLQPGATSYVVNVPLTNNTGSNATLYGWLDINQNGAFSNSSPERQTTTVLPGATSATLVFTWTTGDTSGGNGLDTGATFLRLRLSTDSGLAPTQAAPTDFASDGEVEDHRVQVSLLTCDRLYGLYDNDNAAPYDWRYLREYDSDTVNLPSMPTTKESAAIGIDRIYRRLYYVERVDATFTPGDGNNLYFYDPTLAPGAVHINTGGSLPVAGGGFADNYNRMAFSFDGRGMIVESEDFQTHLFDPTASGTGQFVSPRVVMNNAASILGAGGDVAFDRDGNLYMVTYTYSGGAPYFYYLYQIRFFPTGADPLVDPDIAVDDIVINASTGANYFAYAFLLLTESKPGTEQVAGMAFNFDNLIYLQANLGQTYTWNVGITAQGGSGAIQYVGDRTGSSDLASCIYPFIRAILEPTKTMVNLTSGGSGFVPADILEYSVVVRNSGGFPSFDTSFQDDIPAGTTYVPNTASMNGDPLPDTGGLMPFVQGRLINTAGQSPGVVLADITPGIIGDNEVVIRFRVRVNDTLTTPTICNQGFVDFQANLSPDAIPTDNPGTSAASDPTCRTRTTGFKVNGRVFEDRNVDGLFTPGEPGLAGVAVVLYDSVAATCMSALTDASGFYEFTSVTSGPKILTERSGALVPVPAICPPPAIGTDPSGYISSTTNQRAIYVINQDIEGINFGDVPLPQLTPNLEGLVAPGGIQTYSHLFIAPANGAVDFSTVSSPNPVLDGWTSIMYLDQDCSGNLSLNDSIILAPINMLANQSLCVIHRVFAPTTSTAGNVLSSEVWATYNYAGSLVSDQETSANDFTTVRESGEGTLQLTKRVRNITLGSPAYDAEAGISNQARPGDRLRYEVAFANTGVGNISDINIYDTVPAFTSLAESLDINCEFIDSLTSLPLAEVPPTLTCTLISPSSVGPNNNQPGYRGALHWQLIGTLAPGQVGRVVFSVDLD